MPLKIDQWRGEELKLLMKQTVADKMRIVGSNLVNELKEEDKRIGNIGNISPSPAPAGGPPATVTGRLAGSWTYNIDEENLVLRVGSPLIYALYQELGTSKMPARPTLRPVFLKNIAAIQKIFGGN